MVFPDEIKDVWQKSDLYTKQLKLVPHAVSASGGGEGVLHISKCKFTIIYHLLPKLYEFRHLELWEANQPPFVG